MIGRGTSLDRYITVDIDLTDADVIFLTFTQGRRTVVEKTKNDLDVSNDHITYRLTQEETLRFDNDKNSPPIEVQIRAKWSNGDCARSNIMTTTSGRLLKDGMI